MNTTASYSTGSSWSRRSCSTETIFSIQGRETDVVRDTSDTESVCSDGSRDTEYEPVTEAEDDGPVDDDSSGQSENEIIATRVIEVSVRDDGDLELADSEQTESEGCDSEMDLHDFWQCARCRQTNNNPLYRYCEKCFKVRKNFFPPRPKRKRRRKTSIHELAPTPSDPGQNSGVDAVYGQNSGVDSAYSQISVVDLAYSQTCSVDSGYSQSLDALSQVSGLDGSSQGSDRESAHTGTSNSETTSDIRLDDVILGRKRRAESLDLNSKRQRASSESDSDEEIVAPLAKTVSDPSLTVESINPVKLTKKAILRSLKEKLENDNLCIVCLTEPKSGVFVHGRIAHICCCYRCAVRVWAKAKRCPVCNCKVSNVLKAVVM